MTACRWLLAWMGLVICIVGTASAQTPPAGTAVTFPGAPGAPALRGHLHRPEGVGPFAAVVLLHGCGGLTSTNHWWADTLRSWGYVALLVDSLGPRGETVVCDTFRVDPLYARMPDAYAARSYLAGQPFVAAARIGLIGWSHGGITTLHAVDDVYLSRLGHDRFRAAIAFYPGCLIRLLRLNAPLLILIGEEDDWTPAARCRRMEVELETSHEFTLKVYPGAYHEFDRRDRDADVYLGHRLERHHEAAIDAEQRVQRFLIRHLGP
jgi:dienelactone hydrolase